MSHAVLKAIKLTHCSQTEFAKIIGSNLDMVNSWINREIKVPLQYAFTIDTLTDGKVTWKEISPHLAHFEKRWSPRLIPRSSKKPPEDEEEDRT